MKNKQFAAMVNGYPSFAETYDEAVSLAKRFAKSHEKDMEVWTVKSTVKFPEPDYEVVEATAAATS